MSSNEPGQERLQQVLSSDCEIEPFYVSISRSLAEDQALWWQASTPGAYLKAISWFLRMKADLQNQPPSEERDKGLASVESALAKIHEDVAEEYGWKLDTVMLAIRCPEEALTTMDSGEQEGSPGAKTCKGITKGKDATSSDLDDLMTSKENLGNKSAESKNKN